VPLYNTELWISEQQFNTSRPESHLCNDLVPKSQSHDVSIRYLAGVMCFGCIQAAYLIFTTLCGIDFDVVGVV